MGTGGGGRETLRGMGWGRGQREGEGEWKGRKVAGREGWEDKELGRERGTDGNGRGWQREAAIRMGRGQREG